MLSVLDRMDRAEIVPVVAAPPEGPLAEALRSRNIEIMPFVTHDSSAVRFSLGQLRESLDALLRSRRWDLLHANSLSMGRLSGPVAAAWKVPSLTHLRDIIKLSRQAIVDLNCHSRLLAVSCATRDYHVAARLSAEKMHVLYNGVDLTKFCPRPADGYLHRELRLSPGVPLIGAIGQIGLRKGHDVFCRAAAPLAGKLPEVHYVLLGQRSSEKAESAALERELRAAAGGPLAGRFHFLGFRNDVDRVLNELTLLVHPARQEPLGRVLLEAAASGTAIVATDVGGTREIFPPDSGAARLVPPDDAEALAQAVAELLADAALRQSMAAAARRRAEAAFDIQAAATRLMMHYRDVANR